MRARFGTAGNPDGFYQAGKKQSKDMPPWLREQGLEAYEYQCGKGVTVGEATARAIGRAAAEAGIALSLHAPYFVNPANPDPDSQEKTLGHVLKACQVAQWMRADRGVVHTGALQKRTREEALATAKAFFQTLRRRCDEAGYGDILLCPETMGKINQLGDLDEVLELVGHPVGGVCPFGVNDGVTVYLDESLRRFETVFPACGSSNSAIEVTIPELEKFSGFKAWVDVCKGWREA